MAERGLEHRFLLPQARVPLGHVARFTGIEPEAEAETGLSVLGHHARDQRLLARLEAHRMDVDEG
jgi:hypothetical protein